MSKLTDLEICKRIAEIEGLKFDVDESLARVMIDDSAEDEGAWFVIYDPLDDDVLCFQLMVDYKIELTPLADRNWEAAIIAEYDRYGEPFLEARTPGRITQQSYMPSNH